MSADVEYYLFLLQLKAVFPISITFNRAADKIENRCKFLSLTFSMLLGQKKLKRGQKAANK